MEGLKVNRLRRSLAILLAIVLFTAAALAEPQAYLDAVRNLKRYNNQDSVSAAIDQLITMTETSTFSSDMLTYAYAFNDIYKSSFGMASKSFKSLASNSAFASELARNDLPECEGLASYAEGRNLEQWQDLQGAYEKYCQCLDIWDAYDRALSISQDLGLPKPVKKPKPTATPKPAPTQAPSGGSSGNSGSGNNSGNNNYDDYSGTGYAELRKGDKGSQVAALQRLLVEHNYLNDAADGDYGGKTTSAIQQVQRDAGYEVTGIADSRTQAYLQNHSAPFNSSKRDDILLYGVDYDKYSGDLNIYIKNRGNGSAITSVEIELHQCNSNKSSIGDFYGRRNGNRTQYYTTTTISCYIGCGECSTLTINLKPGNTVFFTGGDLRTVTILDKAAYARAVLKKYVNSNGSHSANQKLYADIR